MIPRIKPILIGGAALIVLAAIACGADEPGAAASPTPHAVQAPTSVTEPGPIVTDIALADAIAKWSDAGFNDYSFGFAWQCFCIRDYVAAVRIDVRDGQIVAAEYTDPEFIGQQTDLSNYKTVDDLFDLLAEAHAGNAATISASYDGLLGHPVNVFIDYDERIADEERGFTISGLTVQ